MNLQYTTKAEHLNGQQKIPRHIYGGIFNNFPPPRITSYTDDEYQEAGSEDMKPQLIVPHVMAGGSHEPS
ncbi:unnamed protein product [Clonostachys rosea f. rosea IK726]|uniref:Uncharacterized protein n=1 Tax=Clonostachys rosea f. rosea IK726 TaxID=1349383 RepID=A0ACA9UPY7_BIOOC|nr:unnamed protein product [Clonostachys rosea f. rosea IK726]